MTQSHNKNGTSIDVKCNDNAKLKGESSINCNNGTWSVIPKCNIYRCYEPSLAFHGSIEDAGDYLINKTYQVTCDKGYVGSVSAECVDDGSWNITGTCELRNCLDVPVIPNSKDTYNYTLKYTWNDTFTYR